MPYDPSGKFNMNPEAPFFVPGQATRPAMRARNPRDWVFHGAPQQKPDQTPTAPTNTPNNAPPLPKVQLFGAAHGMSFDPNTGLFTGDGAPRKSIYRADGTLPSAPDLESDRLTNEQYSEQAEDQLHILPRHEYVKRMADFGKKGPVQTFRVARPTPQGNQQGTRVMVENRGGRSALSRPVWTAEEMEGGMYVPGREELEGLMMASGPRTRVGGETEMVNGRSIYDAEEIGAALSRLMSGAGRGGEEEEEEG